MSPSPAAYAHAGVAVAGEDDGEGACGAGRRDGARDAAEDLERAADLALEGVVVVDGRDGGGRGGGADAPERGFEAVRLGAQGPGADAVGGEADVVGGEDEGD